MSISSFRKIAAQTPRVLEVIRRENKGTAPRGLKPVSAAKAAQLWDPIIPEIAAGRIPLDERTAEIYANALEQQYRKLQKGG